MMTISHYRLPLALGPLRLRGSRGRGPFPTAKVDLKRLSSAILFQGDEHTGYRDPAAIYHDGTFYLYMSLTTIDPDGLIYAQTAWSKSRDLLHWTHTQAVHPQGPFQELLQSGKHHSRRRRFRSLPSDLPDSAEAEPFPETRCSALGRTVRGPHGPALDDAQP